jgi:two-component system, cell cycle sensor histidine kinase and response regulator CckA
MDDTLVQANKLEHMGRLVGGVAHDINNLLSVILGCAQMARHKLGDHRATEDLREIEEAGHRAAQITRQLLAYSRKHEPEVVTFDAADVIRGARKMLGRLLDEGVELEMELPDHPLGMRADPGQLEQVLVNLAVNARDAMPRGGRVLVRASEVEPSDHVGTWIAIDVEDSGEGMSPDTLARVFEPFFTTKSKDRGTGLGLSVVHGIVTRYGGHIDIHSSPGHGTRVRLLFPQATDLPRIVQRARSVMRAGGERVLLVENDDLVRRYLTKALEANGYSVLPVPDASTAVLVAASVPGIDLVVFASNVDPVLVERLPDIPRTMIEKPVNASRFLETVRETLDGHSATASIPA